MAFPINQIPYVIITLMIAFTVHEFAHAFTAYKFGDPTAYNQGRLTLNPLKHLDPIGTILIFIAGFGWARPVPVNRFFFKKPRIAGVCVSAAGPLSNLLLAILAFTIWYSLVAMDVAPLLPVFVLDFLNLFIYLNILLFMFNLLPLPPLDGYRIIEDLVPAHIRAKMTQYEVYGAVFFLIIVLTPLSRYTIDPFLGTVYILMGELNALFYNIFIS